MAKKPIQPDEKIPLKLTAAERKLVLDELLLLDEDVEAAIKETPAGKPVLVTLDDLEDLAGHLAAEANHCDNPRKEQKLDALWGKIESLLNAYEYVEPAPLAQTSAEKKSTGRKVSVVRNDVLVAAQARLILDFASTALMAAEDLGIKTKHLDEVSLAPNDRELLLLVPGIAKPIQKKLASGKANFTTTEIVNMAHALAHELTSENAQHRDALLTVAGCLIECFNKAINIRSMEIDSTMSKPRSKQTPRSKLTPRSKPKSKQKPIQKSDALFQFKITLLGSEPRIWRRIQVEDDTLDKLHEHIQTAMGWTNSHLHQFNVKGTCYGDSALLNDGFGELECIDSTRTLISEIVPRDAKRYAFKYEYDFGDGWEHEVLFEGCPPRAKGKKYPQCLEGERACPPEDCGGLGGYEYFLAAIADPKHEEHENLREWYGGPFTPEKFDAAQATKAMKKGLPDWRDL